MQDLDTGVLIFCQHILLLPKCYFLVQIYQSSVAYSPDAIQTSGGYFHLGRVFLMEGKIDIASSLHTRVRKIQCYYIKM